MFSMQSRHAKSQVIEIHEQFLYLHRFIMRAQFLLLSINRAVSWFSKMITLSSQSTLFSVSMQFQVMRESVLSQNSVSIASTQTHRVSLECFEKNVTSERFEKSVFAWKFIFRCCDIWIWRIESVSFYQSLNRETYIILFNVTVVIHVSSCYFCQMLFNAIIVIHVSSCHSYQHKSVNLSLMSVNITQFQQSTLKFLNISQHFNIALKLSFLNIKIVVSKKSEDTK